MKHIEKMAHKIWQHQAASGDTVRSRRTFEAFTDQGDDTRMKSIGLAQAVFDELIDVMPDLVWVQVDDYCSIAKTILGNYGIQVVDAEDSQCYDLWLAGEDLDDFADHTFGTEAAAKAHANLTRRAKIRAIWETEE